MHKPKKDWDYIDPKDPRGYYAYFNVTPSATLAEISKAYLKVVRECEGNEFVLNEARIAYIVLSNPQKRHEYDTSHHTSTTENNTSIQEDSRIKISENSSSHIYSGRTMGMPSEHDYTQSQKSKKYGTQQSRGSDGCSGCVTLFIIFLIISGIFNLLKAIFS